MTIPLRLAFPVLAFLFLPAVSPVSADVPPLRKITVMGTAIVKATPDEMDWMVTINANDATLAKAKARHDASLAAALKYLQSLGGALKDLQTGGIRFDHNLYPGDSAYARRNPYSCSTQFTFTLTDFDQYGPIADALARMDGAQVYSVTYASSKEADLRREALKRALLDGHDKARDLAETAGGTIDQPLSVDEQEAYNVTPETMNVVMGSTSAAATPAAVAGQIAFCAKVVASYDFLPR